MSGQQKNKSRSGRRSYKSHHDDFEEQLGFHLSKGKKINGNARKGQVSINHLLDFQGYRESDEYMEKHQKCRNRRRSSGNSGRAKDHYVRRAPLHGMSFINVNYKFVVDANKQYRAQMLDPNVPIKPEDILTIVAPKGNACPICLTDDLVAPRILTSCGHIICLTCLLLLLDSDLPSNRRTNASPAVVEKYKECPLCFSIIRKNDVKPVLINNIDETFEVPKVNEDVVLTLMNRPHEKCFALPDFFSEYFNVIDDFPWVNNPNPDFQQYSRILKGNAEFIFDLHQQEKERIEQRYKEDKAMYEDDGKFVKLAMKAIDEDLYNWRKRFSELNDLQNSTSGTSEEKANDSYHFYQTGFNATCAFVLSPLDIKVLKHNYGSYKSLPSSVIVKVENIRYEELTSETALSRYKYLSHFPEGTLIGFMECDWFGNEFISKDTWGYFKDDLVKRSKSSRRRLRKEDKDKIRAISEEERRTRDFYERENNGIHHDYEASEIHSFGNLNIADTRDLPPLSSESLYHDDHSSVSSGDTSKGANDSAYSKTVWGTKIPRGNTDNLEEDNDRETEELIRKAKEESAAKHGSKRKKKLVLLSSNSAY